MTIRRENVGSKKDFGLIGFSQEGPAQFLIFPHSLKEFEGQRVVEINYELFEPPPRLAPASKETPKAEKKTKPAKAEREPARPRPIASVPLEKEKEEPAEVIEEKPPAPTPAEKRHQRLETARADIPPAKPQPETKPDYAPVVKELRAAMKELEAGKAVLVFRRLEKMVSRLSAEPGR